MLFSKFKGQGLKQFACIWLRKCTKYAMKGGVSRNSVGNPTRHLSYCIAKNHKII